MTCCVQAGVLTPFFLFTYTMYKWERQDLVPIRPLVGEHKTPGEHFKYHPSSTKNSSPSDPP